MSGHGPHGPDPLTTLLEQFRSLGASDVLVKHLRANDNSKNQIYIGKGLSAINDLPAGPPVPARTGHPGNMTAAVTLFWLRPDGSLSQAPQAQLIFYSQYPEVRLSGFLRGSDGPHCALLNRRARGRLLFLARTNTGSILAHACTLDSPVGRALSALGPLPQADGPMKRVRPLGLTDPRTRLLSELRRIHLCGWVDATRMDARGHVRPYTNLNSGGTTLEALLGILPNSRSAGDFLGWEIKQHRVPSFRQPTAGVITLMTPEPTGGLYGVEGAAAFIRRYGYNDPARTDRINVSGRHFVGVPGERTALTLNLRGYDPGQRTIVNASAALDLVDPEDRIAASWSLASLVGHWTAKHAQAAYIPTMTRVTPAKQHWYGPLVSLGERPDPLLLLDAMARGLAYWDPGLKIEGAGSNRPRCKRRNQFRILRRLVGGLYQEFETVALLASHGENSPGSRLSSSSGDRANRS